MGNLQAWEPPVRMRWHLPVIRRVAPYRETGPFATPVIRLYNSSRQWTGLGIVAGPWRAMVIVRSRAEQP
jgi:hypothetical protein